MSMREPGACPFPEPIIDQGVSGRGFIPEKAVGLKLGPSVEERGPRRDEEISKLNAQNYELASEVEELRRNLEMARTMGETEKNVTLSVENVKLRNRICELESHLS